MKQYTTSSPAAMEETTAADADTTTNIGVVAETDGIN